MIVAVVLGESRKHLNDLILTQSFNPNSFRDLLVANTNYPRFKIVKSLPSNELSHRLPNHLTCSRLSIFLRQSTALCISLREFPQSIPEGKFNWYWSASHNSPINLNPFPNRLSNAHRSIIFSQRTRRKSPVREMGSTMIFCNRKIGMTSA